MLKFVGQHVAINQLDDALNHSQNQLIILEQSQGDSGLEKLPSGKKPPADHCSGGQPPALSGLGEKETQKHTTKKK